MLAMMRRFSAKIQPLIGVSASSVVSLLVGRAKVSLKALGLVQGSLRRYAGWGEVVGDSLYVRFALAPDVTVIFALAAIAIHAPPSQVVYQAF